MSDSMVYRPFDEPDLPGVLALWEAAGWGPLDEATWREWFLTTPNGPALVIVGVDAGEVKAQMVFAPSVVDASGGRYRALRLAAPILHPSVRTGSARSKQHPAVRSLFVALDVAPDAGYDVIYAQPERAWLGMFRWSVIAEHFTTSLLKCAAYPLADPPPPLPGWHAAPLSAFSDAHHALWAEGRHAFGATCGVHRTPEWLRYRLSQHHVVEVWEGERLGGYAAVRPSDGLIMDAVAADPDDLARTFQVVAHALAAHPNRPYPELKAMRTEAWGGALEAAGFGRDPYTFLLSVCPLSDRFPAEASAPEGWYAVPSD